MSSLSNIRAVGRREYTVRIRTRSFLFGTLLLVIGVLAIAFLPVIIRYIDRSDATKVAVNVTAADLQSDPVATLTALLNAPAGGQAPSPGEQPAFIVTTVPDLDQARRDVVNGRFAAVLGIERASSGELKFTLYTNDIASGKPAQLVQQASTTVAISDRLSRAGVRPGDQASVFAPADYGVEWPDPARTDPKHGLDEAIGRDMLAFGMTILIFMMIILYGSWVAMSVVEEKSSRVMEVILNAATPFELLTGKVLGVGAVAFTQYAALIATGVVALLAQGAVASFVLGSGGGSGLPEGLTLQLLALSGAYGVLGFLLYAVLYAAAGSLVSRQEDVNSVVAPMTLISTAGYMVGLYAAMGFLDIKAAWLVALSQVPLLSPFMMIGRVAAGEAAIWEVPLSLALLIACIVAALWLAARIYAAGVLLYGQRPGMRAVWGLVRQGM